MPTVRDKHGVAICADHCDENDIFEPWLDALDKAQELQAEIRARGGRMRVMDCGRGPDCEARGAPPDELRNPKTGAHMSVLEVRAVAEMSESEILVGFFSPRMFVRYAPSLEVRQARAKAFRAGALALLNYFED